ncbi:MAG: hypothetical protein KC777_27390 [Cyanobacteria bacterium HKST-UBA02]|nr:hypothetical protein [Cyanobacteria bacterium HKST-UBA02]
MRSILLIVAAAAIAIGAYTFSIIWRASLAEVELFGSSRLLPLPARPGLVPGPCGPRTYFNRSYLYNRNGEKIIVYTDKINCFQHIYGSGLAALELGELPAHLLFCANEFAEYTFDHNGVTIEDLLDRRKDLAHNIIGRKLALAVKNEGLTGSQADERLKSMILLEMKNPRRVYLSYLDPRVAALPSEATLGCPGLPNKNVFNFGIGFTHTTRQWISASLARIH